MEENKTKEYRDLFRNHLMLPEQQQDISLLALYMAGEHDNSLEISQHTSYLDSLAEQINNKNASESDQYSLSRRVSSFLFEEVGFNGNTSDYYNPDNSFLHRVLQTGVGIPITLSIIYMAVSARVGLHCYGAGLPGHFLVGLSEANLYLDPFNRGTLLSATECRSLVLENFSGQVKWQEEFLAPCSNREILFRMLTNLKQIYFETHEYLSLILVLERLSIINPSAFTLYKELAWCHLRRQDTSTASEYLDKYIQGATALGKGNDAKREAKAILESYGSTA